MHDVIEERLHRQWPGLFGDPPVPLACGIRGKIANHLSLSEPERRELWRFMREWVTRPRYLRALAADGALRFDLDGSISEVSEADREHARGRLRQLGATAGKPTLTLR